MTHHSQRNVRGCASGTFGSMRCSISANRYLSPLCPMRKRMPHLAGGSTPPQTSHERHSVLYSTYLRCDGKRIEMSLGDNPPTHPPLFYILHPRTTCFTLVLCQNTIQCTLSMLLISTKYDHQLSNVVKIDLRYRYNAHSSLVTACSSTSLAVLASLFVCLHRRRISTVAEGVVMCRQIQSDTGNPQPPFKSRSSFKVVG